MHLVTLSHAKFIVGFRELFFFIHYRIAFKLELPHSFLFFNFKAFRKAF